MTPSEERSYQEVLGSWMANAADDIRDMGRRVQEVLTRDPRDHHYAATKMTHALLKAVEIMVYANSSEDELLELVRDAQQTALRRAPPRMRGRPRTRPIDRTRGGPSHQTREALMSPHPNPQESVPADMLPVAGVIRTHWTLAVCVVCGHEQPRGERSRASCPGCGAQLRVFTLYLDLHANA